MTEQEHIDALVNTPPHPELTRAAKVWRIVGRVLIAISLVLSVIAIDRAVQVGQCINSNLGSRNAPTANDSRANIAFGLAEADFATTLANVLKAPKAQASADYQKFLISLHKYQIASATHAKTLATDQAMRNAHPLGRC